MVRRVSVFLAALVPLALAAPCALAVVDLEQGAGGVGQAPTLSNSRVIVQWAPGADRGDKGAARAEADVSFTENLGDPAFQLVEVETGQTAAAAADELEDNPAVVVAEPDGYRSPDAIPDDPLFGQLWGLRNTGAGVNGFSGAVAGADADVSAAWDRTFGTPSTVIADIDSGYRFDHPDLAPVDWTNPGEIADNEIDDDGNGYVDDLHGYDFVGGDVSKPTPDSNPSDNNLITGGHGIHTAGTIGAAGNDGFGVTGVARNVRLMPLRVCSNHSEKNELLCSSSAIVAAINYAGNMGARAANMSLSGTTFNQAEVNAIAANPETLYVVSAGNDGVDNDGGAPKGHHYPCDYAPTADASPAVPGAVDNVLCVAATDQADALASFSDWGATSVDLGAPGTEILSTYPKQLLPHADDFELDDFADNWVSFGWARAEAGDGPLTSFGMSDSPGADPTPSFVSEVTTSSGVMLPVGSGSCRIKGQRMRKGGAGAYGLIIDGSTEQVINIGETAGPSLVAFQTAPILGLGGHLVRLFFRYSSAASPLATDGFWIDNLQMSCYAPLNDGASHGFLQGTSMAAPHVTGAAALLFSLKPEASVEEVREALLDSTEAVPSLAGKSVTGGRLDVAAALENLVPIGSETVAPDTAIASGPFASGSDPDASFAFERTEADGGEFECRLDGADWLACTSPAEYTVAVGSHQFEVRAKVPSGLVDPSPAERTWTVTPVPPPPPVLESTSPASPAENGTPLILGSAAAGTQVEIYANVECEGIPVAAGSAAELADPGIAVSVPAASSRQFSATATNEDVISDCSDPILYANSTKVPDTGGGGGTVTVIIPPQEVPPAPASCKVPKLAGKALSRAKTALKAAGCPLGRVTKPKARPGQRPPALVVKSSSPAAGATTGGKVNLRLGPKPRTK